MKSFEEVYDSLPSDGWLTEIEARLLWEWVNKIDGPILEVGSYQGRSTCLLAATGRPVIAVDPFEGFHDTLSGVEIYRKLINNLKSRALANVKVCRYAVEYWKPEPVNFAYLDGDHTAKGTLHQLYKARAAQAKIIAVHDVNDTGDGCQIKRACLSILGNWTVREERLAVWDLR